MANGSTNLRLSPTLLAGLAVTLGILATPGPRTIAQSPPPDSGSVTPGAVAEPASVGVVGTEDLCRRAARLRGELELLRFHMGRPRDERNPLRVHGATLREASIQMDLVIENLDRLTFEFRCPREGLLDPAADGVDDANVVPRFEAADARIARIRERIGIDEPAVAPERTPCGSVDDVLREIILAHRQLNLLLERPVAPEDVYVQVTRGIALLSRVLEVFPEPLRIPADPPFRPGTTPGEVHIRLRDCFTALHRAVEGSGLRMLDLEIDEDELGVVAPSDVLHLASMLVADLALVHRTIPGTRGPRRVFAPGRKFPSHVFQRVGVLEEMLVEFERLTARHPRWVHGEFEE